MPLTKILPNETASYNLMLRFVSKSQLVEHIHALEQDETALRDMNALFEAVQSGNYQHPIFEHPNCQEYVLLLLKQDRITIHQCHTLLSYLMSLAQYTVKQMLREEDSDVKLLLGEDPEMCSLMDESTHELTEVGALYIDKLIEALSKKSHITHPIDRDVLLQEIQKLPASEKCLLSIPWAEQTLESDKPDLYRFTKITIIKNLPIVQFINESRFVFPSFSIISLIMKMINPNRTLTPIGIFGSVNQATLEEMHRQNLHPVSFYSNKVKSNQITVHRSKCGGIPAELHDLLHVYMGTSFKEHEYRFIFDYLIPVLKQLDQQYGEIDPELHEKLQRAIVELGDLNLRRSYGNDLDDFSKNIRDCLGFYPYCASEFAPLGGCTDDDLYYLLARRMKLDSQELKEKYHSPNIRYFVTTGDFHRPDGIPRAIESLIDEEGCQTLKEAVESRAKKQQALCPDYLFKSSREYISTADFYVRATYQNEYKKLVLKSIQDTLQTLIDPGCEFMELFRDNEFCIKFPKETTRKILQANVDLLRTANIYATIPYAASANLATKAPEIEIQIQSISTFQRNLTVLEKQITVLKHYLEHVYSPAMGFAS